MTDSWTTSRKQQTVEYLTQANLHHLTVNAFQFLFCELLNAINIVLQIWVWNKVFNGKFLSFGPDVVNFASSQNDTIDDPISALFPKITKCNFRYFGPSGSIQQIDAVCVLPLNIVNEKMFTFLWFWFFFVAVVTFLGLIYNIVLFSKPTMRIYLLQAQARYVPRWSVSRLVRNGTLGHWFLLHQLGRNLNPFIFGDLVTALARVFDRTKQV